MFLRAFQDWFKLTESWLSLLCHLGISVYCACFLCVNGQLSKIHMKNKVETNFGYDYKTPNGYKTNYWHILPHYSFSAVLITVSDSVFIKESDSCFPSHHSEVWIYVPGFTCEVSKSRGRNPSVVFVDYPIFTFTVNSPLGKKESRVGSHHCINLPVVRDTIFSFHSVFSHF